MPGTFINEESRVRADVLRLIETRDQDGNVIMESFSSVYGTHWADIQPMSNSARIVYDQLKIKATHKIFPEPYLGSIVQVDDFYQSGSNRYRVVGINDFRGVAYYDAWQDIGGIARPLINLFRLFFSFDNIGPGTYTFGSGAFSSVKAFSIAPAIIGTKTNDSGFFIDSITANGFRLVDRGMGLSPLVTVYIIQNISGVSDVNYWSFSGLMAGNYTFGTSPLTGMPAGFDKSPVVWTQNNNYGDHYITNRTATGFTIIDRGTGSIPSVTAVIMRT